MGPSKQRFIGAIDLLKERAPMFRKLVATEMATKSPGIAGEFLFTSISLLSEVVEAEQHPFITWTNFTNSINDMLPKNLPPLYADSRSFTDSLRTTAIVESTLTSYIFANGVFLLVILLFTGNFLLTLIVMISLILILLTFAGLIFFALQIEFGPVESLGVSIFVGLSANYLLHIAHSYHTSKIKERDVKIQHCIWMVGSPILWSAISTIGGIGFLLALLSFCGPLPLPPDDGGHLNLHTWDLMIIITKLYKSLHRGNDGAIRHSEVEE